MITVDTTCLGVMSQGSDIFSGSCAIGFETRRTMFNCFTIMDVNRRRD